MTVKWQLIPSNIFQAFKLLKSALIRAMHSKLVRSLNLFHFQSISDLTVINAQPYDQTRWPSSHR